MFNREELEDILRDTIVQLNKDVDNAIEDVKLASAKGKPSVLAEDIENLVAKRAKLSGFKLAIDILKNLKVIGNN